jgi:hypothetical protein
MDETLLQILFWERRKILARKELRDRKAHGDISPDGIRQLILDAYSNPDLADYAKAKLLLEQTKKKA